MAEASKPERPSRSKKAPEPDFSPFVDWLINGPAGKWPKIWESKKELTKEQKKIVATNAQLLLDRDAWISKIQSFEAAISAIPSKARQKDTRRKYAIRFDRFRFADGSKNFANFMFPCEVSFKSVSFGDGTVRFDGASFDDSNVVFDQARFGDGEVWFKSVNFGDGDISFTNALFGKGNVFFYGATFGKGNIMFVEATFGEGNVLFFDAKFGDGFILFQSAVFGDGNVHFGGAKLGNGDLIFSEVTFGNGDVSLNGVTLAEGNVRFDNVKFQSTTLSVSGMEIFGNLYVKSHFPEAVDFSRLDVKGIASFSGSSYEKVPDFRGAKFDRPPEVADMQVPRPKLRWSTLAADPDDVAKFRKLKVMALAANDHEKDGEFFAGEMLAKRGFETKGFFGLLFNTIYWWLSDFGQSYVRPLGWLGVSFLSFAAGCLYVIRDTLTLTDRLWFAADFSFRNMLPLFGSLFRFASAPQDHVSLYQSTYDRLGVAGVDIDLLISFGIVQSLIGTLLLFLFLLGLRNKFRLK